MDSEIKHLEKHEKYLLCCGMCTGNIILNILAAVVYRRCIPAHVGHKRGTLSAALDVVIIRHGARQMGGVHCWLCAARPIPE